MKDKQIEKLLSHPDKDQVISKLVMDISPDDIVEWLKALYQDNKDLVISKTTLKKFKEDYLDFYTTVKQDLQKTYSKQLAPQEEINLTLQNNSEYQQKLEAYLTSELDIKTMLKKMIAQMEWRADSLFTQIAEDPRNMKMNRDFLEFMNTLLATLEKYRPIIEGDQGITNINNTTYNIQIVDQHINVISSVLNEVLAQLDYETSLMFTELLTERLAKIKEPSILPQLERLELTQDLTTAVQEKLLNPS